MVTPNDPESYANLPPPDPFLGQPNPHTLTFINPRTTRGAHEQSHVLKQQAKLRAEEEKRIHHEQKALAKGVRRQFRTNEALRKKEEKQRKQIEKQLRRENELKAREEKKTAASGETTTSATTKQRKKPKGIASLWQSIGTERSSKDQASLENDKGKGKEKTEQKYKESRSSSNSSSISSSCSHKSLHKGRLPAKDSGTTKHSGGISWGFDPGIPVGGIESGGPGKEAGFEVGGLGLTGSGRR